MTLKTREIPTVRGEAASILNLDCNFRQIERSTGSWKPEYSGAARECGRCGVPFDMMDKSFFASRETLIASVAPGMAIWREKLFVSMSKNATRATEYFKIPTNRVVELGTQVEL